MSDSPSPTADRNAAPQNAAAPDTADSAAPLSEADLQALRNRDPDAVQRWIYGHRDYIEGVLRRYSRDADVARDLVQEAFFQALRSLPNFRGDSKLTTWLHSIASFTTRWRGSQSPIVRSFVFGTLRTCLADCLRPATSWISCKMASAFAR